MGMMWWVADLFEIGLLFGWGRVKYRKVSKLEDVWKLSRGFVNIKVEVFLGYLYRKI